jgi:nucleotide-binding universal stress UspA family protein
MMEEKKKIIVVPWDFTHVAEYALAHAVKISRMTANDICLLHIVDKGIKLSEEKSTRIRLQKIARENGEKYGVAIMLSVVRGSIFSSISEFANDKEASLIVMGTHGIKGMQKLTGSWALKVIIKSKAPCIIVQEQPTDREQYNNIVFPIDFRAENREKIKMAIFMGKYFNSKIHLLVTETTDSILSKKTKANLNYGIKYFIQNNIEHDVHLIPKGSSAQQILDFAVNMEADLILIVTTKNITFADYVIGASEQYIIANSSKIPVCCINPMTSFASAGQFMGGGWGA